ncbi:hypothetical protein ACT009_17240 [Sphingomonas sp. Tas61C01]|uniref:hypothetical protein n=1 Tax=Sphingomonas sp. Tas61C01 TaxID=3458297 RepID=UPI00403ED25F
MKHFEIWALAAALAALVPTAASAEPTGLFGQERPVSGEILAGVRGGSAMLATMSIGRLTTMTEAYARSDSHVYGATGQYQMDIWWSTTGSEIIAENVRAATGAP